MFEATAVHAMGHGFRRFQNGINVEAYSNGARFFTAQTLTNAACQTAYNAAPTVRPTYTGELIKAEMICVEGGANRQVCDVRILFLMPWNC